MKDKQLTIIVEYNGDTLLYGGKWYILKLKQYLEPLHRFTSNASVAYREKGGTKFYYHRKMQRLAKSCRLSYPVGLPCPF